MKKETQQCLLTTLSHPAEEKILSPWSQGTDLATIILKVKTPGITFSGPPSQLV